MRNFWKWVILCLTLAVLLPGCGGGNSFDGVWKGTIEGYDLELAFIDDYIFMIFDEYDIEFSTYTFMWKEGILETNIGNFPAVLKGNTLTLNVEGTSVVFDKDTRTAKAPASIRGVWKGPDPWVFAFINDKVYIVDEDEDPDFGTYTFNNNSGSFETENYSWEMDFTVKGNTLTTSDDLTATFTRTR
jgi:hypothetical protein